MANDYDVDQAAPEQSDNEAPDFIPAGQEPWEASAPAPDFIPEGQEPWAAAAPDFIPEGNEPWKKESTAAGAFARSLGINAIPFAASLAPMAAGARVGAVAGAPFGPLASGAGAIVGGATAGGVAAYAAAKAQKAAGIELDPEQAAADEEQHPWATAAGRLLPNVIAFSPGKLADSLAQRLLMGTAMGAIEAGQELATEGKVSAGPVLESAAVGAIFQKSTRVGAKFTEPGERFGEAVANRLLPRRAGDGVPLPPAPTPEEDQRAVVASAEAPKNSIGVAQAQPKPVESEGIGNPQSAPERSERVYGNREARRAKAAERLAAEQAAEGDVPADVKEALAPEPAPVVEPASPAVAASPPAEAAPVQPNRPEPPPSPVERPRILPPIQEQHLADVTRAEGEGMQRAQAPRPDQMGELTGSEPHPLDQPNAHMDRVPERPLNARPEAVEAPKVTEPVQEIRPEPVSAPAEIRPQPETRRQPRVLEDLSTSPAETPVEGGKPIDRAIEIAKSLDQANEMTQKLMAVLNKARENPKLADVVAKRFLAQYGAQEAAKAKVTADVTAPKPEPRSPGLEADAGRSGEQSARGEPSIKKTDKSILDHDGRVVGTASTVRLARERTNSLKVAKEVQDRHTFPDTDPRNAEQVAALREKAKAVLADAEESGYKTYLPHGTKDGEARTEAQPSTPVWLAEVKKFALGKPQRNQAAEVDRVAQFISREKLLRAGDVESGDIVRSDRRTEAAEFYRPHKGEAGEVTSEGNIAPKRAEQRSLSNDEPLAAVYAGPHVNVKVEPSRTTTLREALHPDEQMLIGGEFMEHHEMVAKAILAAEPNVPVHHISDAAMKKIYADDPTVSSVNGFYDFTHHAIFIRSGADTNTLLHEGVHAALGRKIDADPVYAKRIRGLMEATDPHDTLKDMYPEAFQDEHEFLAYGMTDPNFQSSLARTRLSPMAVQKLGLGGRIRTAWDAFLSAARDVLGLGEDHMSALEGVIKLADQGLTKPGLTQEQTKPYRDAQGREGVRLRAEQVQSVRDQADGLLKQLKGAVLLKVRDTYNISRAADKLFGGADNNPTREIADRTERARVRSLELAREWDPLHKTGLELKAADPTGFHDMETLMQAESQYQRYGDLPLNQHPYNTKGLNEEFKNAQHPDLERRWNALSDELKQHRDDLYQKYGIEHDALAEQTAASRLLKELGIDDTALAKRVMDGTLDAADFQRLGPDDLTRQTKMELIQDAAEIGKLQGPYSPAMRRGRYAVTGEFKVPGTDTMLRETVPHHAWETDNKQTAIDFANMQEGRPHIDSYYVDATTGDRTTKVTEPVMKDGVAQTEPGSGRPLTHDREIPLSKNDPNTVQRWQVRVDRGYLKMFDTNAQALAHERDLHQSGSFDKTDSQPKKYQPHTDAVTLASNLTNLEAKLKNNALYENMTPAQKASVKQLLAEHYLQMLAATRVHSSKLHRNFVKGADDDIIRNTLDWAGEASNRRGRMEHQVQIDEAFKKANDMVNEDNVHSHARRAVVNELQARHDAMKDGGFRLASGQMGPFQQRLMSWSYTARLATPGFTIRNLTQPGLFLGEIAGKHGYGAGFRELGRVYKDIAAGKVLKQGLADTARAAAGKLSHPQTLLEDILQRPNVTVDDKFAIQYMVERGRIDPDAGFAMGETIRRPEGIKLDFLGKRREDVLTRSVEGGLNKLDTGLHWIEEVSRQMPRAAETVNRVGMGLAAFRLEMRKNGGDREKAARYADDAVAKTQFVYSDTNKPTWQRNPFARAAFQFKQFGKSTYEFMGRHIAQSIDSQATPEERSASRKALGGLFVTHTLVAGALGLPWEPVRALLIGAKQLGWPNKEWDDVENGVREAFTGFGNLAGLNEKNAKRLGEVLSRGLPRLAGIDLSPGLGLDNMLLFGSPRSGTDREMDNNLSAWLFNMMAGAPTALQVQAISGVRDLMHGEYAKGVEKLMPMKIVGDTVKAGVGLAEGKKNARGRETSPPYTPYQAGLKVMGLPVGEEAERNAYQHQVYQQGTEERTNKSKLIADWLKADSPAAKDKASRNAFDGGIKPVELTQALQRERSADKRVVDGVMTTKATRPIADRLGKVYNFNRE